MGIFCNRNSNWTSGTFSWQQSVRNNYLFLIIFVVRGTNDCICGCISFLIRFFNLLGLFHIVLLSSNYRGGISHHGEVEETRTNSLWSGGRLLPLCLDELFSFLAYSFSTKLAFLLQHAYFLHCSRSNNGF